MKVFIFILSSLLGTFASAADTIPIGRVEEYVAKKMPCDLSVVHVLRGEKEKSLGCSGDCAPDDRIFCV